MTQINIREVILDQEIPPGGNNPVKIHYKNVSELCPFELDSEFCRRGLACGAEATLELLVDGGLVKREDVCAAVLAVGDNEDTLTYKAPRRNHSVTVRVRNFDGQVTSQQGPFQVTVKEDAPIGDPGAENQICIPATDVCASPEVAIFGGAMMFALFIASR